MPYWPPTPKRPTRQTGKTEDAAPHGRTPVNLVGSSRSTAPGPLTRPGPFARNVRSPIRPVPPVTRDRAPLPPAAPPPSPRPRAVFRERGGKSLAGSRQGRPAGVSSSVLRLFILPLASPLAPGLGIRRASRRPRPRPPGSRSSSSSALSGPSTRIHQQRQELRHAGALLRRLGHRDLQPQCHLDAGQGRRPRREHPHLPRPRQRLPEPVRRLPGDDEGRAGPERLGRPRQLQSQVLRRELRPGVSQVRQERRGAAEPSLLRGRQLRARSGLPTKSAPSTRVDYFAGGFLRAGARAVFANGKDSLTSIIRQLLTTSHTIAQIFTTDPAFSGRADFRFASKRTPASRPGWIRTRPAATTTRWSGGSR